MSIRHRQIEAFRNVVITGTTTRASDLMSISQPAISRLISDLEQNLDFKLFKRQKGRLIPTQQALSFYQSVEQLYVGLDSLETAAKEIRAQKPAALCICATPAISTYVFPKAITEFSKEFPNVDIMIENGASPTEVVRRLQSRLAHIGITLAFAERPGIIQKPLTDAVQVCAMHESHPLAQKDVITAEDFEGQEVLRIIPSGILNWNKTMNALDEANVKYKNTYGIQHSHTGYSLIAQNLAIALIEPFAASTWRNNGVITKPFYPEVIFKYVISYPENQPEPTALHAFVEYIYKTCKSPNQVL